MSKQAAGYNEPVAVWLQEPGEGKPGWGDHVAFAYLPPAPPLAKVGDIILLPRGVTGDSAEQAFAWGARLSPFKVIQRVHAYFSEDGEQRDPRRIEPARYMRSMLLVRRLTQEEYDADPERAAG